MLFGVYGNLGAVHPALLFASPFLVATGFVFLLAYLGQAFRYWFLGPVACVGTALALYAAAILVPVA